MCVPPWKSYFPPWVGINDRQGLSVCKFNMENLGLSDRLLQRHPCMKARLVFFVLFFEVSKFVRIKWRPYLKGTAIHKWLPETGSLWSKWFQTFAFYPKCVKLCYIVKSLKIGCLSFFCETPKKIF